MSEKSKEQDTANQLAGLHISDKSPSPEMRPPRPPRPVQQPPEEEEDEDDFEEEDENDPFADRNAVTTPKAERFEPVWYVIFQVHSNHDNQRRNIGELFDPFLLRWWMMEQGAWPGSWRDDFASRVQIETLRQEEWLWTKWIMQHLTMIHSLWFMTRATQHSRAFVPTKQTTPTSRHQISQALFHILSLSFVNVWVIENHHDWKVCWSNIAVYTMRMPHLAQDTFHLIIGHKWFICRGWFNCISTVLYIFTFYICTALKQQWPSSFHYDATEILIIVHITFVWTITPLLSLRHRSKLHALLYLSYPPQEVHPFLLSASFFARHPRVPGLV